MQLDNTSTRVDKKNLSYTRIPRLGGTYAVYAGPHWIGCVDKRLNGRWTYVVKNDNWSTSTPDFSTRQQAAIALRSNVS